MLHPSWADDVWNLRFGLADRKAITLANGVRTIDYQVWCVAFSSGDEELNAKGVPKGDRSEEYLVTTQPIILRELQDDRNGVVLYKKLQEACPERLYGAAYYYLEYRLPGAPFTVRVRLDNPDEVKRAYHELGKLTHKKRLHMGKDGSMRVVPRQAGRPCFDFTPEPSVKVAGGTLKGQSSLTAFLADQYIAGRISAAEFDTVMHQSSTTMRQETFKLIPAREQVDHEYLLRPAKPKKEPPIEDRYHLGLISLSEYADLKRPDHAADRDRLKVSWPQLERTFVCVVCGVDRATIKCMECENRCCRQCVRREFSEHANEVPGADNDSYNGGNGDEALASDNSAGDGSSWSSSSSSLSSLCSGGGGSDMGSGGGGGGGGSLWRPFKKSVSAVSSFQRRGNSSRGGPLMIMAAAAEELGSSGDGGAEDQFVPGESFLLIHHIYCLRNGRPSRAFLGALPGRQRRTNRN
eukprot:CAMPEP_0171934072 /NCGR_PEP_ID=MMETSP0993-20121228/31702_1 /TAXON_ID=483369 /ORGANISM="non described non described, Strain CCMP2098" /LENGTH=464 /DNA_ID=CAMNT_0012574705 /DNA_START=96 /DNA_END=1490 /DNA_ORIENTATION=-